MDGYRIFTFSPTQYPAPKKFNDYLHSKKFKSVYMIDPGAKVDSNYFVDRQGLAKDYFVRRADGSVFVGPVWPGPCHFPDFTRPEVRSWWGSLYKDFMATGIDGIWNDMNEPALSEGVDGTMPEDNVHLGGRLMVRILAVSSMPARRSFWPTGCLLAFISRSCATIPA